MDNFVQRLRDQEMSFSECWQVMLEAANRIEALEAALREIEETTQEEVTQGVARRALEGKNG